MCAVLFCLGSWHLQLMKLLLFGQVLRMRVCLCLTDMCHKATGRINWGRRFLEATHCRPSQLLREAGAMGVRGMNPKSPHSKPCTSPLAWQGFIFPSPWKCCVFRLKVFVQRVKLWWDVGTPWLDLIWIAAAIKIYLTARLCSQRQPEYQPLPEAIVSICQASR